MTTSYGAATTPVSAITPALHQHDTMHNFGAERAELLRALADHHERHPNLLTVSVSPYAPVSLHVSGVDGHGDIGALIDWFASLGVEFAMVRREHGDTGWCHLRADADLGGHAVTIWGAAPELECTPLHTDWVLPVRFLVCARDVVRTGWAEAVASLDANAPRVTT